MDRPSRHRGALQQRQRLYPRSCPDQDAATEETEWLRGLIAEGLASGVIEKDASEVLREIMAERPARKSS